MTELTFSAGERATLDLRDSQGEVRITDGAPGSIAVSTSGERSPFVLRDGDTFRVRLEGGGAVAVPPELPVEVIAPAAVRLRLSRRGETEVTRREPASAGASEAGAGAGGVPPVDLSEFARAMSEQSRRIFDQMTEKVRQGGFDASVATDDVARRLDEAAERIDEQVQRVAVRVEREVERAFDVVDRAARHAEDRVRHEGTSHAERAAERERRHAEREAERASRVAERVAARASARGADRADRAERRAGRGRWWFTDRLEEAVRGATAGAGVGVGASGAWTASVGRGEGGAGGSERTPRPSATPEERRVILDMLAQGTISAEQAARLLDALGG